MLYPEDKGAMQLLDRTEELIARSDEEGTILAEVAVRFG